jgi:hypothetical protein
LTHHQHSSSVTRTRKKKTADGIEYEEGSGNVFADLGLPDPEALMAKALLYHHRASHPGKGLTDATAAELMPCTEGDGGNTRAGDFGA